ncbi:MAG: GNAT family N-acetyltransferase, partial [Kiritimatiellae bacterium]|nr:GNAT family N-acetyltransferase [Kiritimatiellia bacterium]
MKIELARAGDRTELLDFLFSVFLRDHPNHMRFERLFPDLFDDTDEAMGRHAVVRESGRIVACVGAYHMKLRVCGCDVPLGGIGQVSTGADWLGRGFMSALLKFQLERLRSEGAALAWLGGRHDRYSRFGFETGGGAFSYGLDSRSLAGVPRRRKVEAVGGADAPAAVTPDMIAMRDATAPAAVLEPV